MQPIRRITFEHESGRIKFSHDGSRFLVFNRDKIASYTIDGKLEGKPFEPLIVFDAAYLNGTHVVAAILSQERQYCLTIYNLKTRQIFAEIALNSDQEVFRSVCVDQQRGRIFAAKSSYRLACYDLSLNQQNEFQIPYTYMPFNLAISHSGDKLGTGAESFGLWDVSISLKLISEECPKESDCLGTPCEVGSADITPDGRYAVAGFHGAQGICAVIDGESGKVLRWYGPRGDEIEYYATRAVTLSPDGKYVIAALDGAPTFKVYNVSDGTVYQKYEPQEYGDVVFSPKGDMIAVGGENSVTLWPFEG